MTYSDIDIIGALGRGNAEMKAYDDESAAAIDNWIRVIPSIEESQLQPASIDLRLGTDFVCFSRVDFIDMRDRRVPTFPLAIPEGDSFELKPRELVLGTTIERIELGSRVRASIEGKSSLGRMGLAVHVTAGFVDPGFRGQITLELFNIGRSPILLRPGLAICQIAFVECMTRARRPYGTPGLGSHYQDQAGAVPVRP